MTGCFCIKSRRKYKLGKFGGDTQVDFNRQGSSERVDVSSSSSRLSLPTQAPLRTDNDLLHSLPSTSQSSKSVADIHREHDASIENSSHNLKQSNEIATSLPAKETQVLLQTPSTSTNTEPTTLPVRKISKSNTIETNHESGHIVRPIGFQLPIALEMQRSAADEGLNSINDTMPLQSFNISEDIQEEEHMKRDEEIEDIITPLGFAASQVLAAIPITETQIRVKESVQFASYKRSFSRNSQKSGFIVDVPAVWGIGPDGSSMESFNKAELKNS